MNVPNIIIFLFIFVITIFSVIKFFKSEKNVHKLVYGGFAVGLIMLMIFQTSLDIQEYNGKFGNISFTLTRYPFSNNIHTTFKNESTEKTESQELSYVSPSMIEKVTFTEGEQYITQVDGGKGATHATYKLDLPPGETVTGNVVTTGLKIVSKGSGTRLKIIQIGPGTGLEINVR